VGVIIIISVSKLICGTDNYGDHLRYTQISRGVKHGVTRGSGPVVVWNCTRTCNLRCVHCYMESAAAKYDNELNTEEAKGLIDDLAAFKVPVLLFSGGEPLIRPDFFDLASYAIDKNIRVTISTNGTLIDKKMAKEIKKLGVGYVGISLDGMAELNDEFRNTPGAFKAALKGIRNCLDVDQRVGLRFTLNRRNYSDLENILQLVEQEGIPRVCFYHLVYSGRGSKLIEEDLDRDSTRQAMDIIIDQALYFQQKGLDKEILTVDNHADGIYIYLRLLKENAKRAEIVKELLLNNGGNRTGIAIGQIDNIGNVHADQFTQNHTFGNIRERKFSEIWTDLSDPILAGLKDRKPLLKGRCAGCQWLQLCNGNFRSRAEAVSGDFWESDPACYLTDQEIGLA
jgi:Fe-coproporphyrin III synthase